jgi:hypothetical protein
MTTKPTEDLLFVHIPKTAGYSIRGLLMEMLTPANVSLHVHVNKLSAAEAEGLLRYRLIAGHLSWDDVRAYFANRRLFTFLRDPIERCLSVYGFYREKTEWPLIPLHQIRGLNDAHEAVSLARQLGPDDFFRSDHPHVRQNVENRMVWQLGYRAGFEHRSEITAAEALARARRNLRAFSFIGLYERLEQEIPRLLVALGLPEAAALPSLNRTVAPLQSADISAATRAALERLTELDRELYDAARHAVTSGDYSL